MTRDQLLSQASSIKQAVCSVNNCSEVTVEGLRRLLQSEPSKKDVANAVSKQVKAAKVPTLAAGPTRPVAKRSKLRSVVAVVEVHQDAEGHLEVREKVKLATEVVNAALKGLTDAAKAPASPKPMKSGSSMSHMPSSQSIQSSKTLRIRCANQLTGEPNTSNGICGSRRSSSISCAGPDQGVIALATCAREALAFMRRCSSEAESLIRFSLTQVDSGMSALINKLIGLGLDDLATKELRILLKRLCGVQEGHATKSLDPVPKQQTLSDLLIVEEIPRDAARLALLVTSQLQVLRLIAAKRRPVTIEAALEHLKLSIPYSPVSLIQQASSKSTPAICEKAARQLESFAQVLQSIVARSATGQDSQSKDPRASIAPHVAVEYQLLVLETRIIWWKMLGHRVDTKKELLAPFSSIILSFNQRSNWSHLKQYDYCSGACDRFFGLLECQSHGQPLLVGMGEIQSMKCDIFKIIADSARNALRPSNALNYLEKCLELSKELGRSQASTCAFLCQILSIQLKIKSGLPESISYHLESLVSALRSNLSGESAELDDFLLRVVQLQRLVLTALFGVTTAENRGDTVELPQKLQTAGFSYILECSLFLKRYLGKRPDLAANIRQDTRYAERKTLVGKIAISVVESIAGLARTVSVTDIEKWRRLNSTISYCTSLMIECENTEKDSSKSMSSEQATQTNWRQLISGVHWSRFLGLKQQSAPFEELLGSLLTSISLLDDCSTSGQFQNQICTRLDRLGALYESKRRWTEAKAIYSKILDAQATEEWMAHATTAMSKKPLNRVLQDQDLTMWNRTISALSRTLLKADDKDERFEVYNRKSAPCSIRGMILEHQLAIVESTWLDAASAQALKSVLNSLAHNLLEVYEPHRYPIRRMRVILSLSRVELTIPGVLTEGTRDRILQDPLPSLLERLEEDADLLKYACHLKASIELVRNFLEKDPSATTCQEVLNAWKLMIECSSGKLTAQVDDIPSWAKQLRMLAEYFGLQGLEVERAETLHMCLVVQEYEPNMSTHENFLCQMDLCLQLLELGHSEKASLPLQMVRKQVTTPDIKPFLKFQWHIVSATHGLQIGSQNECQSHLSKAGLILAQDSVISIPGNSATTRLTQVLQKAFYSFVQAAEFFSRGLASEAIFYARCSVKLSYRAWALLEHKVNRQLAYKVTYTKSEAESMAESTASLSIADDKQPIVSSTKHESLNGSAFWSLVPILVRRLLFLASLFEYSGLVAEAQYYIDQASRIADVVKASSLQSQCLAWVGILALRRWKLPDALECLKTSISKVGQTQTTLFHARLYVGLHEAYVMEQDWGKASCSLQDAETAMGKAEAWTIMPSPIIKVSIQKEPVENDGGLASRLDALTIASKPLGLKVKEAGQKTSMAVKKIEPISRPAPPGNHEISGNISFQRLRGTIKYRYAFQALLRQQFQPAVAVLSEAAEYSQGLDETARQHIWQAQAHLSQGFAELSSDSVFCVLHESSISYPSMLQGTIQEQEAYVVSSPTKMVKGTRAFTKTLAKKGARKSQETSTTFCNFKQSLEKLKHFVLQGSIHASSRSFHAISDRLVKSLLMLSATSHISSPFGLSPTFALYSLELGRCSSAAQESLAIQAERLIAQGDVSTPLDVGKHEEMVASMSRDSLDYATFQKDFIDIIPENWTVISISLSESRDELRLSKVQSGRPPFIVMIPLNRHNSRDADEETFGFDQCKAELTNIIDLANYSTHDERDFSKKGAKTEWWEARAVLDARLKDLLVNMENIWLGGFRGLFGQQHRHSYLLARFKQSFDKILNTHLPSRRRIGKVGKNTIGVRVELDSQVLELIIGLGNPTELDDLDEPLLDLLYFVIDILQFHGERNAYDEIDFDAIIVETLDALRQYHHALLQESQNKTQYHTLLILDKAVHAFPWESLPCLKGKPVTRLPSLIHLRSRILDMWKQSAELSTEQPTGPRVDSQSTSYILNPSADLAATESTFFPYVTSLPSTSTNSTQIIHRAPSSSEFQTALSSSSLLLYFGHGSGGQYIRSRTIQKLDHCAVALLLGCSSAKLIEEGEYEPHGVVNSYLVAGAPAVVGTLWDVTDKDIDRWSLDCLERWGLFEEDKRPIMESPTKKLRGRGKAKVLENGMTPGRTKNKPRSLEESGNTEWLRGVEARGKVSLDRAVALARDKCLMKYLNGAAPVVYGIPVYLS